MGEKYIFEEKESVKTINNILNIAEKFKDQEDFNGKLANALIGLSPIIANEEFIKLLNDKLVTCRDSEFAGLKIVRAWDGGFKNFTDEDHIIRMHRLALFLAIYLREISFRGNFYLNQRNDFYTLNKLVGDYREELSEGSAWCFDLYDDMPCLIMREEFHSDHAIAISRILKSTDISKVEEFIQTRDESISKIDTWNNEFESKKSTVETLKNKLDTYQTAFNFVGLYQGFSQLKEKKDDELFWLNFQYYILVFLMITIPVTEFCWLFNNFNEEFKTAKLVVLALPSITLLIVLFWLFRILLQNIKSIQSQIMQLELRMTLCQFIQSYAEKSKELKEQNKEGFEKFESLIFSSIVSSDDKIPSTFDGMEQLSSLLKSFKS